jgi:hypothetical protein
MTNPNEWQPPLPGLDTESIIGGIRGSLRTAVEATLDELKTEGLLTPVHTASAQLALTLADGVERAAMRGQGAAMSMGAAQLLAALDTLPKPLDAGTADAFGALVESLLASVDKT